MHKILNKFLEWSLVVLLGIMLFSVLWGVATRYLLEDQSSWTDELARFMLIWVSIVGATYIAGRNEHITIDLLPAKMAEKNKLKLDILVSAIIILFVIAVFVVGGLRYVYISFHLGQRSAAMEIPMGYVYTILPICGLIITFFKINTIRISRKNLKSIN
ncbi:TRAP transporter small permease [Gramella sp. GC03-9]|uniref:TRAP transporter small permease n=1 Tax=Christiangramia oceanisediminis TaxID=2920386 RepID=A0A9X2KVU3_9FLAO|nr:TRAP transporter small permease [Gramella oceanisediminis]MCP9199080.1 TRAP transporter small permease [Gramella oceanisediminis]